MVKMPSPPPHRYVSIGLSNKVQKNIGFNDNDSCTQENTDGAQVLLSFLPVCVRMCAFRWDDFP